MSPKSSSLAIDEVREDIHEGRVETEFEPKFNVHVNKRNMMDSDSDISTEPVKIRGRITVSF